MVRDKNFDLSEWWPDILSEISSENPQAEKYITAAEVLDPWGEAGYRKLYTVLIPPDLIDNVLEYPGGIGVDIEARYPDADRPGIPSFSIWGGGLTPDGFEPLIYAWESNLKLVLWPDPGFLMTYHLIPRWGTYIDEELIHWDDVARPCREVVIAKPVTQHELLTPSNAEIKILREYLEDYATGRNMHLVQVMFAQRYGYISENTKQILDTHGEFFKKFPGRGLEIRRTNFNGYELLAKVWLVRKIIAPGKVPIFKKRWDYGELIWPGSREPVTENSDWLKLPHEVYIRDTVLAKYEGHDEFKIIPELGSVSCGGQWAVGYCRRVGRDLIAVELRKLYEGVRSEVTQHWHKHAVEVPEEDKLRGQRNIASRTKKIVYSLCQFGEALAFFCKRIEGTTYSTKDVVGLDRATLDYYGWWRNKEAEKAARHAPIDMSKGDFLQRAEILSNLVIDGFSEKFLRKIALIIGSQEEELKDFKSIKLLERIMGLIEVAIKSGLKFPEDNEEINARQKSSTDKPEIEILKVLYKLRLLDAHRSGKSNETIKTALQKLNISWSMVASGWRIALDQLYDLVSSAIEKSAKLIRIVAMNNLSV